MLRHKNLPDKEIWDELKYWLQNPVTEKEQSQREQAETNFWDQKLNERFAKRKVNGVMTGAASSDGLYDAYKAVNEDKTLSPEEKVQRYQEVASNYNKRIAKEDFWKMAKLYGGAALEIGSAAIPGLGGAKVAGAGFKLAKPLLSQIAQKELAKGTIEGLVSGGLYGLGEGLMEDKNLLKTVAKDAVYGATGGNLIGQASGKILSKVPRIKQLDELVDKRQDWGIAYTKQSGNPQGAVDKLLEQKQGFVPKAFNKEGIGDVDLVWGDSKGGLKHIIDRRNNQGINGETFVKNLPSDLKNGEVLKKQTHTDRNYILNNNKEIAIKSNWDGKPRNWVVSAYNLNKAPSQALPELRALEQTPANGQQISPSDFVKMPNNIIQQSRKVFNTTQEWLDNLRRQRGHMK